MTSCMDANMTHPENKCGRCGGPNIAWTTPSPLWNVVMRGGDIGGNELYDGIVCLTCFAVIAEENKIAVLWRLTAQRVNVSLTNELSDGRVWNEQNWLWEEITKIDGVKDI